jgi:hypothetical protein
MLEFKDLITLAQADNRPEIEDLRRERLELDRQKAATRAAEALRRLELAEKKEARADALAREKAKTAAKQSRSDWLAFIITISITAANVFILLLFLIVFILK